MNEALKRQLEGLDVRKYKTQTGRMKKNAPPEVKTLIKLQEFQELYGWDTYDYSKYQYLGSNVKSSIICKEHGLFLMTTSNHLQGQGCPACGNQRAGSKLRKDPKKVLQDFRQVHNDLYDYSKVVYTTAKVPVEIICKSHGSFWQTPDNHLHGQGCPSCGRLSQVSRLVDTQDRVLAKFQEVHGDNYNYKNMNYTNQHTKVQIICKNHGIFTQTPHNHEQGHGCPKCQVSNQNILYVLKCLDTGLIKIGITNNLKQRISSIGGNLEYLHHVIVDNPREHEKILHNTYKPCNVFNPNVRNGGTEFFQLSQEQVQEVIHYLESVQQGEF